MSTPPPPGPSQPTPSAVPPAASGARGGRSRGPLPWILGGVCALLMLLLAGAVALGALWFFVLRPSPQDAVEQYLEAWLSHDCASFQEVSTEEFRGEDFSCEAWEQNILEQSDYSFEHEIGETRIDGDTASVDVIETITLDGETDQVEFTIDLIRQDGRWLVDSGTVTEAPDDL